MKTGIGVVIICDFTVWLHKAGKIKQGNIAKGGKWVSFLGLCLK